MAEEETRLIVVKVGRSSSSAYHSVGLINVIFFITFNIFIWLEKMAVSVLQPLIHGMSGCLKS